MEDTDIIKSEHEEEKKEENTRANLFSHGTATPFSIDSLLKPAELRSPVGHRLNSPRFQHIHQHNRHHPAVGLANFLPTTTLSSDEQHIMHLQQHQHQQQQTAVAAERLHALAAVQQAAMAATHAAAHAVAANGGSNDDPTRPGSPTTAVGSEERTAVNIGQCNSDASFVPDGNSGEGEVEDGLDCHDESGSTKKNSYFV